MRLSLFETINFADEAHRGQTRKYTKEPYIMHPMSVFSLVASVPHTQAMLHAAVLHDVVEDTHITIEEITELLGDEVSELVAQLTDVSKPEDGNRAVRKALDRDHLEMACAEAQTIKVCDLIDNTSSIVICDPKFAKTYLREKAELLKVLGSADTTLLTVADMLVQNSAKSLGIEL